MSKKSLEFHIKSDDYFGTLATILNLINQNLKNSNFEKEYIKVLNKLVEDLVYLQDKYKIVTISFRKNIDYINNNSIDKDIMEYFRGNIFEAFSAYSAWKIIILSRSEYIFPGELKKNYLNIQNYHPSFFSITEQALFVDFVMMSLHSFDIRDDSFSLYKMNKDKTEKFVKENSIVIDKLKKLRHKVFAHKADEKAKKKSYKIPSFNDLDCFFENLINFYNSLTLKADKSKTLFENAENQLKSDIKLLFMNLDRGESIRKQEIDIK